MPTIFGAVDLEAEDDGVVEFEVVAPDPFGAFEVVLEIRALGTDFLLGEFLRAVPLAVVEIDGEPVVGNGRVDDAGIDDVSVDRAMKEDSRLPLAAGVDFVADLQNESAVADAGFAFAVRRAAAALAALLSAFAAALVLIPWLCLGD